MMTDVEKNLMAVCKFFGNKKDLNYKRIVEHMLE